MSPKIRFALDSPLEGDGFEPSVPGAKEPVSVAEDELRGIERGPSKKVACGPVETAAKPGARALPDLEIQVGLGESGRE